MGCSIFTTPFVLLGVKVRGAMSRIKPWDDVVWRFFSHGSCQGTRFIKAIYGEDGALNSQVLCLNVLLGEFSVKSVRQLIDDLILPKEEVATRWVKVWPIKINVFAWRVRLDKLPTQLNLSLKGPTIEERAISFPEAQDHVKKGPLFKRA
ncbi:hypothetical protein Tco_0839032 [Tanacetum coccineum]|uniref:Reverse transcriptase zinc-binding domain-containing protein n=1 Tax=Tanacetum coccineum TaxID=301880 RepID=A0ABQ5APH9_9ASTR